MLRRERKNSLGWDFFLSASKGVVDGSSLPNAAFPTNTFLDIKYYEKDTTLTDLETSVLEKKIQAHFPFKILSKETEFKLFSKIYKYFISAFELMNQENLLIM